MSEYITPPKSGVPDVSTMGYGKLNGTRRIPIRKGVPERWST
jgi:hypothetical protein